MNRKAPDPPDSPSIKLALLPARIAWWRRCGCNEMADKLAAELTEALSGGSPLSDTIRPREPAQRGSNGQQSLS